MESLSRRLVEDGLHKWAWISVCHHHKRRDGSVDVKRMWLGCKALIGRFVVRAQREKRGKDGQPANSKSGADGREISIQNIYIKMPLTIYLSLSCVIKVFSCELRYFLVVFYGNKRDLIT